MKLGIMQPYFMPYIGYWQLMHAVDQYVVYDDVNYIKGGWINRNRILVNGEVKYFNLQLSEASPNKKINEVYVADNKAFNNKNLRVLEAAYKKAPYYNDVFPVLEQVINGNGKEPVSMYIMRSFEIINNYLGLPKKLILSSDITKNDLLTGEDKVIDICKKLGADEYYNAIGGVELYSKERFNSNKLTLSFLKTGDVQYKQFTDSFAPNLSIIDVLMFNSVDQVKEILKLYEIL